MKHLKHVVASALAVLMALVLATPAFAAAGDKLTTPENTIKATGVTKGDSVAYYHLAEWDSATGGWKLTALGITACGTGDGALTIDNLTDDITEEEATKIANNLAGASATGSMDVDAADTTGTTFTKTNVAAGLYYLKATPASTNKDNVYNPAFVSADYYEGGNTVSFSSTIGSSTVVKKSKVTIDKEVTSTDKYVDVKPGDVIPFKVTTKIPSFGTTFEHPKFQVSDVMSTGLTLEAVEGVKVTVKYGDTTVTDAEQGSDLTITSTNNGYTVAFKEDYLKGLKGATPDVEITYKGKVGTDAPQHNVDGMTNTATVTFSNTPTSETSKDDITRHYTFSIDGNLLGGSSEDGKTSELIKTGVDAQGNPITEESEQVTYHNEKVSPLAGASFKLVGIGDNNSSVNLTANSTSDGRINFNGLDAGRYILTEESAPAGFVKDSRRYLVTITPTYSTTEPDKLESYTISFQTVDAQNEPLTGADAVSVTAGFQITNEGPVNTWTSAPEDHTAFIKNTEGNELPSTGGMGTTILYTIGGLMIAAGGVALITKKRLSGIEG